MIKYLTFLKKQNCHKIQSKYNQLKLPIQIGIGCNISLDKFSTSSSKILNNVKNTTLLAMKFYSQLRVHKRLITSQTYCGLTALDYKTLKTITEEKFRREIVTSPHSLSLNIVTCFFIKIIFSMYINLVEDSGVKLETELN